MSNNSSVTFHIRLELTDMSSAMICYKGGAVDYYGNTSCMVI